MMNRKYARHIQLSVKEENPLVDSDDWNDEEGDVNDFPNPLWPCDDEEDELDDEENDLW